MYKSIRGLIFLILAMLAVLTGCGGQSIATPAATLGPVITPTPGVTPSPTPISIEIVDPDKQFMAIIETEKGNMTIELFAKDTPITASNFIQLSRQGFYDNTTFHRVIPGFMAQGGDPTGTGYGGPGYFIPDEITQHTHVAGALSMANRGVADTGGSQFFITYVARHDLDGRYSVFGQLIEGMDVMESLTPRDPTQNPDYEGDALIKITIVES